MSNWRKQTLKAINQVKELDHMSLSEINLAQRFFQKQGQANQYLSKINQQRRQQKQIGYKIKKEVQQIQDEQNEQIAYLQQRKWNEQIKNQKKGKFSAIEKQMLMKSVSQYLFQQHIKIQDFWSSALDTSVRNPNRNKMWIRICSVLPNRTIRSSYRFLIRQLQHKDTKKQWTPQDEQRLTTLYRLFGNDWKFISKQMGFDSEFIRTKWRKYIINIDRNKQSDLWTTQETIHLLKQLENLFKIKIMQSQIDLLKFKQQILDTQALEAQKRRPYNSKNFIQPINQAIIPYIKVKQFSSLINRQHKWKYIAQKIQTKTDLQCKNKFYEIINILDRDSSTDFYRQIINFIKSQGAKEQQDIRWSKWKSDLELPVYKAKLKWVILKRKVKKRKQESFEDFINRCQDFLDRKFQKNVLRQFANKYSDRISKRIQKKKRNDKTKPIKKQQKTHYNSRINKKRPTIKVQ